MIYIYKYLILSIVIYIHMLVSVREIYIPRSIRSMDACDRSKIPIDRRFLKNLVRGVYEAYGVYVVVGCIGRSMWTHTLWW